MTEQMSFTLDVLFSPEFENRMLSGVDWMDEVGDAWKTWVGSQNQRTGTLANTATYEKDGDLNLLAMFYLHFAFYGTGVYGPQGVPFGPVTAPALHWLTWPEGIDVVRMWSSGYIWDGALDSAQTTMEDALRLFLAEHPIRPEQQGFWQSLFSFFGGGR